MGHVEVNARVWNDRSNHSNGQEAPECIFFDLHVEIMLIWFQARFRTVKLIFAMVLYFV